MPKEPNNPRDSEKSAPPKDQTVDVCEVPGGDAGAKKGVTSAWDENTRQV